MAATCQYCEANEAAYEARLTFGVGSPEHREALKALAPMFQLARLGRQHSAECIALTPMVVIR